MNAGAEAPLAARPDLARLTTWSGFVGFPRSGHSVVGNLLNAHPDVLFCDELNALAYVRAGASLDQMVALTVFQERIYARRGRNKTGFSFAVPNQHQGRIRHLRVLGDSRARTAAHILAMDPNVAGRIRDEFRLRLRLVFHVRNPFDMVATSVRRLDLPIDGAIEQIEACAEAVDRCLAQLPADELHPQRHEDFLAEPATALSAICRHVGVEPYEDYVADCVSILFPANRRSRDSLRWSREDQLRIEAMIERFGFFAGYSFKN